MSKLFGKSEENNLRKYTMKRINKSYTREFLRKFSVTNWIIIINCFFFVLTLILIQIFGEEKILSLFALEANKIFSGFLWTPFTSMFIHIELWHLLANMFSLFFIGNFLEKLIGRKRFLWLYLISGIFAGFFYAIFSYYFGNSLIGARIFGKPDIFAVGASGAIFSLLGVLAILTPNTKVYLIAGPLIALILQSIYIGLFPNSGILPVLDLLVYIYILVSLFSIFSLNPRLMKISLPIKMPFWLLPFVAIIPLVIVGLFVELPIGNTAHFGGLLAGLFFGTYLINRYKKKTALIRRYFSN